MVAKLTEFVKIHKRDILLGLLVLLLSLLSFGIGYLKAREDFRQPLIIELPHD
ncbi:MAG: hypothetical protein Q8P39_00250 [Candidatus Yanofskybacteria bacterium]|nr:hypothetical protein [Candidatus Yanofskybacteria bacterium]